MHVEMKHRLPGPRTYVEHGPVSLLDVPLARNLGRCQVTAAYQFGVVSLLVPVNFLRGNLAAENAAEEAIGGRIGHGRFLRQDSTGVAEVASGRWSVYSAMPVDKDGGGCVKAKDEGRRCFSEG